METQHHTLVHCQGLFVLLKATKVSSMETLALGIQNTVHMQQLAIYCVQRFILTMVQQHLT